MENLYLTMKQQNDSRIKLAKGWQKKGFYLFATSTIIQAHEAIDEFESWLNEANSIYANKRLIVETISTILRSDIEWAVRELEGKNTI
jgi:hypothetical protein